VKTQSHRSRTEAGKIGKITLLWLLGIPLPIAILAIYLDGCR
jgi:hypothetical protein